MKISVFGSSYVGLVTAVGLSEMGNTVICYDNNKAKIESLMRQQIPFYEPQLSSYLERNIQSKRLVLSKSLHKAVQDSHIIFLTVGTPTSLSHGADLSQLFDALSDITQHINGHKYIVIKSTVPVGTYKKVETFIRKRTHHPFSVISNPEFLKQGAAIEDFMRPDRIVVGVSDDQSQQQMEKLFASFVRNGHPVLFMDHASAEMTKYASNTMLATKISFINQIAQICEILGADINEVRKGIGFDKRIGFHFTHPGIGYGGSCLPKDLEAMRFLAETNHIETPLLNAVEKINTLQSQLFFNKIKNYFKHNLTHKRLAVWGLAFKPETDDKRQAPSLKIIRQLLDHGAIVQAFDPIAKIQNEFSNDAYFHFIDNQYQALESADALVLTTEWRQFREPDFEKMKALMRTPVIFDGRNQYDLNSMKDQHFTYFSIGRPSVNAKSTHK